LGQPWRFARCRYVAELERVHDDADRQREHTNAMFDQVKDLADRLDRLHRERQAEVDRLRAELERARRSWWRRLVGR
jgi:hypothetical protein